MNNILELPHRPAPGLCMLNGLRDLIHWRSGRNWSTEFLYGLSGGSGFFYLRHKLASPPRQVYWGAAPPHQHADLAELLGAACTVSEGCTFKHAWDQACRALEAGTPPVLGPLDMYHLPYYRHIYHRRHIPIHYLLLVGFDERNAYVYDTDKADLQAVPLEELRLAWDVNVPAMGKRNRLVVFDIPQTLPPDAALVRRTIADKCRFMQHPPTGLMGIKGMRTLARQMVGWPLELGETAADACLLQVREYLNTPPDLSGDNLTAARYLYVTFLEEAGEMAGLDFSGPVGQLRRSMAEVPLVAQALQSGELEKAAGSVERMAGFEEQAYSQLHTIIG